MNYNKTMQNFQPLPSPTNTEPPNKKFPVFYARRGGQFYTWTCIATQLLAVAMVLLAELFVQWLPEDVQNTVLTYCNFSTQLILVGCVLFFFQKFKTGPVEAGWRKVAPLPCLMGILLGVGTVFAIAPVSALFDWFLSLFGYEVTSVIEDIPMDGGLVFLALFLIAVLPAVFEEFIFRGIILESTKKMGTLQACLLNGLLFSLFHCNPSQTGYTFLLGAVFALIAIRCNSIIPTVIVHFLNNAYSVLMTYFQVTEIPEDVAYVIIILSLVCTIGGLIYFLDKNKSGNERPSVHAAPLFKGAMGGLIFNGVLWLIVFISGIFLT
ncbi:MAG: CPBP family intramembrane metalloprotease [Clostridia bacterium]|nr:CPBP family intramembrane metalloprotease [Clostridia bacterium]